jgi:hypothetical protein
LVGDLFKDKPVGLATVTLEHRNAGQPFPWLCTDPHKNSKNYAKAWFNYALNHIIQDIG